VDSKDDGGLPRRAGVGGEPSWCRRDVFALDAATAKALAGNVKWDGSLLTLTAFGSRDSVAIAEALASRKGPLALPSLEKISAKTLTALIEKQDVQIPLIEELELIPEPDGGANEGFVIPKWLEDRQEEQRRRTKRR
jgi:hypothetical protein